jgi:hypothetical protein
VTPGPLDRARESLAVGLPQHKGVCMSETTTLDTILYAPWTHCEQHHGARLQVDPSCPTCLALHVAVLSATPDPLQTARAGVGRPRGGSPQPAPGGAR